eukprot:g79.t1
MMLREAKDANDISKFQPLTNKRPHIVVAESQSAFPLFTKKKPRTHLKQDCGSSTQSYKSLCPPQLSGRSNIPTEEKELIFTRSYLKNLKPT